MHRGSNRITPDTDPRLPQCPRIAYLVRWNRHVSHADLIAVIEGRRAAERQQQNGSDPRLLWSNSCRDARPVVIAEHPVGPCTFRQRGLILFHEPGNGVGLPRRLQQLEIEGEMRAFEIAAVIFHQSIERQIDFADQDALLVFLDHRTR